MRRNLMIALMGIGVALVLAVTTQAPVRIPPLPTAPPLYHGATDAIDWERMAWMSTTDGVLGLLDGHVYTIGSATAITLTSDALHFATSSTTVSSSGFISSGALTASTLGLKRQ